MIRKSIRQEIRNKLSIDTLNHKLMENRELHDVVFAILDTIPHVRLYGYKIKPLNYVEDFTQTNIDYLHKATSSNGYSGMAIDMRKDIVDCAEVYLLLTEDKCSVATLNVAKANTKREILSLKLDYVNEKIKADIMTYDLNYVATQESLLIKFNLYIPRLTNNVMLLNNNHYFNKYYIQKAIKLTAKGKLEIKHHSYKSYFLADDELKMFTLSIFGKIYNPLVFSNEDEFESIMDKVVDEIGDSEYMIKFDEYFKNTVSNYHSIIDEANANDEVLDKRRIVRPNDMYNAFVDYAKAQVFEVNEDTISLHNTIKGELRIELLKSLKLTGKMKRSNLIAYKSSISVDPRTVCTIIKSHRHYELGKSANEIDTFNFFTYISSLDNEEGVVVVNRNFQRKQIGVIDPIGTTTSENVGTAGLLCFSIPDKYIRERE